MSRALRVLPLLFVTAIFFALTSCGEAKPHLSVEGIAKEIRGGLTFPAMVRLDDEQLSSYFNLSASSFEDFEVRISDEDQKADEYAVFEMKKETDLTEVYNAISIHIADRSSNFKQVPQEYAKFQNNVLRVKDRFMILVVCGESERAAELLENMGAGLVNAK